MHVIAPKRVYEFIHAHPDTAVWMANWLAVTEGSKWSSLTDVRQLYPHADGVTVASGGVVTVFNVRGGNYRLLTAIHYNRQKVYVLRLLTHAEYDKQTWKAQL